MNDHHAMQAQPSSLPPEVPKFKLSVLDFVQVMLFDEALSRVGPFGEVRLIKNKGKLRFIQTLESRSAF